MTSASNLYQNYENESGRAAITNYVNSRATQVQYFRSQGYSVADLAEQYGKSKSTIRRDLRRQQANVLG